MAGCFYCPLQCTGYCTRYAFDAVRAQLTSDNPICLRRVTRSNFIEKKGKMGFFVYLRARNYLYCGEQLDSNAGNANF